MEEIGVIISYYVPEVMFSESPQFEILSPPVLFSAIPLKRKEVLADIPMIQKQA